MVAARRCLGLNQRLGLSRNKVAVPEGVAGTPPFWRPCATRFVILYIYSNLLSNRLKGRDYKQIVREPAYQYDRVGYYLEG